MVGMIGFVMFFIGLILIICYPINVKKNHRCTEQTEGVLVKIQRRFDSDGHKKSMHIYSYEVDGIEYQLKTLDHSKEAHKEGDTCTIWYNPKKPKDAQAFRGSAEYLKKLLLVGVALFVLGIIVMFVGLALMFR